MPLRTVRLAASLVVAGLLCSCGGDGSPFEPLPGGLALPVTLTTTEVVATASPEHLEIVAVPGGAEVSWDLVSAPCLLATATAQQSGQVIEVRIHRSGDPLGDCAAVQVHYHYVARVQVPAPGSYDVRLVDDLLGQPLRPVGRRLMSISY